MSLQAAFAVRERDVDLAVDVGDGEVVAVLGPNGAGKSTLLEVVAGLLAPDRGAVVLDGRTLVRSGGGTPAFVPAYDRGVALLAQEPRLFPHLSARDNVAFGPRSQGRGRRHATAAADLWLGRVGMDDYADRRPAALSGGQAQRVALARALAAEPRLMLLDEPLAALDVAVAPAVRQVLRTVLAGTSALMVTHDVLDALLLARRVVVVEAGRVVEEGPVAEVLGRPRSAFGARIAGLNLVRGRWEHGGVRTAAGVLVQGVADGPVGSPGQDDGAVAVFRPSAVAVHHQPPGGSVRNVVPATVTDLEPRGDLVRVRTVHRAPGRAPDLPLAADVTPAAVADLDLVPGSEVLLAVKASEVAVYPA